MSEKVELKNFIENKAFNIRVNSLIMTTLAGSGHPTSCLSAADLVAALFFDAMHYDPDNYDNPNNDRFILSKGHAAPVLYAAWKEVGVISQEELMNYRKIDSPLEGHPTLRFAYAEAATGALGIGLSIGVGEALAARLDKRDFYTYVMMGDGELAEGAIWEAAEVAAHYKLTNLVGIVDCNRLAQSTESIHNHHVNRYAEQFAAFGWHTIVIDGHNMQEIMSALQKARAQEHHPTVILAKTFKGHGVALFENKEGYHGKALSKNDLNIALSELEQKFPNAVNYCGDYQWKPQLPQAKGENVPTSCLDVAIAPAAYKKNELLATRKAFGHALTALGKCKAVVALDGDVKNSTFTEYFESKYPERFFQCYIAEQNMVSMGVGMQRRGKVPFIATFAAFLSRAHDQIPMAAIGTANLRLVGSHAGVSIGQDGPSQMGLEDIAMMRALPESVVVYPCDAVSTHALTLEMAKYDKGISYMRTTRMDTPVLYDNSEQFEFGGCKVLRESDQDLVCVIGAGVTVFEALKAYDILQQEGISIAVIDLYSIKPLDGTTLRDIAKKANNCVITVEDHYLQGGLGEAVTYELRNSNIKIDCLAVTKLPRSGKPEELLAWAGIDAAAIVKAVKAE